MDIIADETMWKLGLYPIRQRPASANRVRKFDGAVPFMPEEISWVLSSGPCSESVLDLTMIVSWTDW